MSGSATPSARSDTDVTWKTPLLRLKPLATISSPTSNPSVTKEPAARVKEPVGHHSTDSVVTPVVTVETVIVTLSSPPPSPTSEARKVVPA